MELCLHNDAVRGLGGELVGSSNLVLFATCLLPIFCLPFVASLLAIRRPGSTKPGRTGFSGIRSLAGVPNALARHIRPPSTHLSTHLSPPRRINPLTNHQVNPEKREILPKLAFTGFASRFVEPKEEEGFVEVRRVEFEVRGLSLFLASEESFLFNRIFGNPGWRWSGEKVVEEEGKLHACRVADGGHMPGWGGMPVG